MSGFSGAESKGGKPLPVVQCLGNPGFGSTLTEPIHIPGSIQSHGVLLDVDVETLDVLAVAGAIEGRLGLDSDWLGMPVAELLGQAIHRELQDLPARDGPLILDEPVEGPTGVSASSAIALAGG
jgi:light-regulated signal transduction histidine kinase (bacteriophytochrome)